MSVKEKPNDVHVIGINHDGWLVAQYLLSFHGHSTRSEVHRVGDVVITWLADNPCLTQISLHTINRINKTKQNQKGLSKSRKRLFEIDMAKDQLIQCNKKQNQNDWQYDDIIPIRREIKMIGSDNGNR